MVMATQMENARVVAQPVDATHGPRRQRDGTLAWRVWAPKSSQVTLVIDPEGRRTEIPMKADAYGYFVHRESNVAEGLRYAFKLDDGQEYPDPASRWQPDGVNRPSAVFFPDDYAWHDAAWRGVPREDLVIYELHVGTFTPEGTFDAIIPRLPQLASLGVTALEIMPVAQFSGARNWGYDGVHPYAVQNSYGGPRALQRLVDAAHQAGLAVLLDVVYNHIGPEGNYLGKFGWYFTEHYRTPWGDAINFDGPSSDAVRQFVIDNARMWVRDFHLDGLRLDAVDAIYDLSARHILEELQAAVQREAAEQGRTVHVIAESDLNDVRLTDPVRQGGYGLDAAWNDDFHHSLHSLLTGEQDGYYMDFGQPEHLAKTFNEAFVYDGSFSRFRKRRHGNCVGDRDRTQFVVCIQNHDQIGNRATGDRLTTLVPPAANRLACGLLLLSPYVPLLYMGEEYGETRPFPFFCSFSDEALVEAVRAGRRAEFAALEFTWGTELPDAQDPATFASAKLQWNWPDGSEHALRRRLYEDLLRARRRWPPLRNRQHTTARLLEPGFGRIEKADGDQPAPLLLIERGTGRSLIACANLTAEPQQLPSLEWGDRQVLLSTEEVRYGGTRDFRQTVEQLLPYELLIFGRKEWLS
jgi:maltooligosyltrehalose trehalohydrolase